MIADPVLVLVDVQNDFCQADGEAGEVIRAAAERAGEFLETYRASGRTPVLVRTTHDPADTSAAWMEKYGDEASMPCRPGTEGAAFVPELGVEESDVVVTKHRYSGFHNTELETVLSSNDVSRLLVGGVNTEVCVASTVYDAFNRDYGVTVLADCTATSEPDRHDPALATFDDNFGGVADSTEVDLSPV